MNMKWHLLVFGVLMMSSTFAVTGLDTLASRHINDDTPPEVTILNPQEGYLHFSGKPIMPNPFGFIAETMSPGGFRLKKVTVTAHDDVDFEADLVVTFYLNGEEQAVGSFVPCDLTWEWQWTGWGLGTYTLTVTAEDLSGNVGSAEMDVWYFCFIP
jgi:hypothetical protein